MNPQDKVIKIVNSIPAVSADGHGIGVNPDGSGANLIFLQIVPSQDPKAAEAPEVNMSMVANVRLSAEQLKKVNEDISNAFAESKSKKQDKKPGA